MKIVTSASNIARRANRVLQVAQQEKDNSEDADFVKDVEKSSEQLRKSKYSFEIGRRSECGVTLNPLRDNKIYVLSKL